ncbi:SDR family NAD(P)-dependent oxidoreductase [Sphingomonas bisphenolicum]|uniref:Short-chain type dehydrogenase/reductase n=1 Tax=Sphingomonas bisphenolicum TaxID=296544 RepID=A0ABM7GA84_9SPHN|nr:SDR family NAD(P)-dependent oxidoreductase [Sphingomonas bisphenolicum]BBF71990.1 short-chain type dehydrogenase/reductase [Sphingomonas bisphenolicum]
MGTELLGAELLGKVAVVTGGSSGIGLGIAHRLAARGCHVVLIGRNQKALDDAAAEMNGTAFRTDVTDADGLREVAEAIKARFGRLDILINNAGIGPVARMADMTRADWAWIIDTNLWSVINGLDAFLPLLWANPEPSYILNTSSISGMFTGPTIGGYAATKYAVVAMSETLAAEMAQAGGKTSVSVFLPGPVRSNIHESDRNRPQDLDGQLKSMRLEDAEGFENVTIPWMDADDAGEIAVSAMLAGTLYIWTHPEGTAPISARFRAIEQSIKDSKAG